MAETYGNLNLHGGSLIDFKIQNVSELPIPELSYSGAIYYYQNNFHVNVAGTYKILELTENPDSFRGLLGTEWVNPDLSFNPERFNQFQNIDGLTADDNLFSVLQKIDESLTLNVKNKFVELDDVSVDAEGVIIFTGSEVISVSIESLFTNYSNFSIRLLQDVELNESVSTGQTLVYENNTFINKNLSFKTDINLPNLIFDVTHNLGTQYNLVCLADQSNNRISDQNYEVNYLNSNSLRITLNSPYPFVRVLIHSVY